MKPAGRVRAALLVAALAAFAAADAFGDARPNIVLIVVDTLRADRLSQYGYSLDTSGSLSKLTDVAVRFAETYSPSPWTKPSVASLFTGLSPAEHQVDRVGSALARSADTLAESLQDAGWETAAFTFNPHITRKARFDQGFDEFVSYRGGVGHAPDIRHMTRNALDWIREERTKPFFLYLQPMNVHGPYRVPKDALSKLLGRAPVPGFHFFGPLVKAILNDGEIERRSEVTPRMLQSMNERYDTAVRHTADELASFFDALDEAGLWENSLIVLTSDHGEELYDHGGFSHRYSLHREVLHVPLFVKLPSSKSGGVVEEPVSLTDVHPTILELVGLTAGDTSLVPLLRGDEPTPRWLRDRSLVSKVLNPRRCQASAVRRGPYSLLSIDRNYEGKKDTVALYDLRTDPQEKNDLRTEHPELTAELQAELERFERAANRSRMPRATYELDPDEKKALEALGYF
jgi:arylsulfatase A-like enzyme